MTKTTVTYTLFYLLGGLSAFISDRVDGSLASLLLGGGVFLAMLGATAINYRWPERGPFVVPPLKRASETEPEAAVPVPVSGVIDRYYIGIEPATSNCSWYAAVLLHHMTFGDHSRSDLLDVVTTRMDVAITAAVETWTRKYPTAIILDGTKEYPADVPIGEVGRLLKENQNHAFLEALHPRGS